MSVENLIVAPRAVIFILHSAGVAAPVRPPPLSSFSAHHAHAHTMYTLLSGLYDLVTAREEVRLLIIGLDSAGKTTLLNALTAAGAASAAPPSTRPTVGLNVGRLDVGGCAVMLWDLGGAAGLRTIWER